MLLILVFVTVPGICPGGVLSIRASWPPSGIAILVLISETCAGSLGCGPCPCPGCSIMSGRESGWHILLGDSVIV